MKTIQFDTNLLALENSLNRFAYSLTSNENDAKDLVQDTFLKALIYKDQFEDNTNLRAWAFAIMRNTFINNYRRSAKQATTFDSSDNQFLINSRQDELTPESSFSANEINSKIDSLEPEFRIPFKMHTSGYKYKEIAESLNLKIGTVKSRIFFSRQKLMEELKDYDR
ncbi:MAG: RNA polymerase sigma factor [Prevotellaceae bacterium]|jgi:RNA polymerase sigma-70 factor (ECF subfamily)|nr:RNA polymerase sigma factor [Prevotellaceae bacterium]